MTGFEQTSRWIQKPGFITLCIILAILSFVFIDRDLAYYFHQFDLGTNFKVLKVFTSLGLWFIYVALFFAAGIYFRFIRKRAINESTSWFLFACVLIPNLINFVLKTSFSRARPDLLFTEHLYGFYWFKWNDAYWSFPSGHSVTIAALASALGVVIPRYFYPLLSIALLVAISRVMLCKHYLSDVMVGFYFSMLVVSIIAAYFKRLK